MIDKYEVDEQKADKETIRELTAKVNEIIAVLATGRVDLAARPPQRVIAPIQLTEHMVAMTTRMVSGPYATLAQATESDELVVAVGTALTQLQNALKLYKESLTAGPG